MIIDNLLSYSDAQALTGTAVSTNVLDHSQDRDIGIGTPMCVCITVDVAAGGTTPTLSVTLQTDSVVGFGSAVNVISTQVFAAAALVAGARFALPVPPDLNMNRFSRLNYTMTGTSPTITVTAELIPQSQMQAEAVAASGFTVQ